MKPYVGITGFTTKEEVEVLAEVAHDELDDLGYQFMLGFISSEKRLAHPSERGKTSPAFQDLPALLEAVPDYDVCLPMIHYFTTNREELGKQVGLVFNHQDMYWENLCMAIQINMAWPELEQLNQISEAFPDMHIVLQLTKEILQEDITSMTEKAKAYRGYADYVLADPSGGLGQELDLGRAAGRLASIQTVLKETVPGIAGGLSEDNVYEIALTILYGLQPSPISWDAQGQLRTGGSRGQSIDLDKATTYIIESARAIRSFENIKI
jgi:phosphoribosylanthranilate isomerase